MRAVSSIALVAAVVVTALVVSITPRRPQDPRYHDFADKREIAGVPNFWNVISNLPFVAAGIAGLWVMRKQKPSHSYTLLFVATILIGLGSAHYHLNPLNGTLTWDRLPMTLAFTAFFAIVLEEQISPALGRAALPLLVTLGVSSVVYWDLSERMNRGDLRPYLLVQFLPLILIPIILAISPRSARTRFMWGIVALYGMAKVCELLDRPVYAAIGFSGHSLKHLAAAAGVFLLVVARSVETKEAPPGGGAPLSSR